MLSGKHVYEVPAPFCLNKLYRWERKRRQIDRLFLNGKKLKSPSTKCPVDCKKAASKPVCGSDGQLYANRWDSLVAIINHGLFSSSRVTFQDKWHRQDKCYRFFNDWSLNKSDNVVQLWTWEDDLRIPFDSVRKDHQGIHKHRNI